MPAGYGDRLASGQKSAIFGAGPEGVSQEKWDAIFDSYKASKEEEARKEVETAPTTE
jgi:hypothetical protein